MPLVVASSPHGVRTTIDRVVADLDRRNVEVFARIDHGGGARAAGLELADEEVLLFGDPRVGTLLMQRDPHIGYELPLRLLAWDEQGTTRIGYRSARDLLGTYAVAGREEVLVGMDRLLDSIIAAATGAPEGGS